MAARRFPPPWSVEDIGAACVVKDSAGQKLGYFYYDEEPGRRDGSGTVKEKSPGNRPGSEFSLRTVCRQDISDDWLGNLRECLAHLV